MGKQAKKRHRAAALASEPHPTPQVKRPRQLNAPPRKTVLNTDALTGDYLDPTLPTRYLDGDTSRPVHVRAPIPTRINTRRETAVGPDWAPEFARYMKTVLPRIVAEEESLWLSWWDIEYVRNRLLKRLGKTTVMVALASLRDGDDTNQIARDWKQTPAWVRRQISITVKLAATYFTPR